MFIASVLLVYGFGYKEYEISDEMGKTIIMRNQVTRNFKKVRRCMFFCLFYLQNLMTSSRR